MTLSSKTRSQINRQNGARVSAGFWTDRRVEMLCRLWRPGANVFDIATKIGGGCTRNMVIGKAHRLNLPALPVNESRHSERLSAAQKKCWADPVVRKRRVRGMKRAIAIYWRNYWATAESEAAQ